MNPPFDNLVPLCNTEDEVHEALIISALQDAELHYVVQEFHDNAYDGIFQMVRGHSRVLVLEDDLTEAQEIFAHIPNPKNEGGEIVEN